MQTIAKEIGYVSLIVSLGQGLCLNLQGLQMSNAGGARCLLSFFVDTNCGYEKEFEKQRSFLK